MKILIYFLALVAVTTAVPKVNKPYSILSPLAQLALASEGVAHDELLSTIGMPNNNVTKSIYSTIANELRAVPNLKMANKIYIQNGAELDDNFVNLSKNLFNTETEYIDFSKNKEAAEQINAWIENNTNHHITDMIQPFMLSSMTASVLLNTFYFEGSWKHKFDKNSSAFRDFHYETGEISKLLGMHNRNTYNYGESEELDAQLIEIPLEEEDTSFFIAYPRKAGVIRELDEKLQTAEAQERAFTNLHLREVDLYIPCFRLLNDINPMFRLEEMMDMKEILNSTAQISHLLKGVDNLYIKDGSQNGYIEVNEKGIEIAEARVYRVNWKSSKSKARTSESPVLLNINRPFYYLLKHKNLVFSVGCYVYM